MFSKDEPPATKSPKWSYHVDDIALASKSHYFLQAEMWRSSNRQPRAERARHAGLGQKFHEGASRGDA